MAALKVYAKVKGQVDHGLQREQHLLEQLLVGGVFRHQVQEPRWKVELLKNSWSVRGKEKEEQERKKTRLYSISQWTLVVGCKGDRPSLLFSPCNKNFRIKKKTIQNFPCRPWVNKC